MKEVGVRELKTHASAILREVREQGEHFEVTYRGRAIARIVPVSRPQTELISLKDFRKEWDELIADISSKWPEGLSAVDAIRDQRHEY